MSIVSPAASCGRASPPRRERAERGAAPVRATPIVLLARRNVRLWSALAGAPEPPHLSVVRAGASPTTSAPRRLVLRRDRGQHRAAAGAGRGCARRARGARLGQLRQLRGTARAARAGRAPQAARSAGAAAGALALFGMDAAGRWALHRAGRCRERCIAPRRRSSTWCARCCAAGACSSGGCWRAKRTGCRPGATC